MRTNTALSSVSSTMSGTMTTGLTDILDGTKSVGDGFASMSKSIIRSLEEAIVKMLVVAPIMRGLQGMMGGGFGGGELPGFGTAAFIGPTFATGGAVSGPGTGTSDSIPALLSNGEFVVKADATAKHRALLETINAGNLPRFADGGIVGDAKAMQFGGGNSTTIAPSISVTVQGSPGQSSAEHAAMGEAIAKSAEQQIRALIGKELRTQMKPGGILR